MKFKEQLIKNSLSIYQLILLFLSFYLYSSTIKFFPWYEPLTMGAYFGIYILLPLQILITILFWYSHKKIKDKGLIYYINLTNLSLLLINFFIPMIYEPLFYLSTKISSLLIVLILIYMIFKAILSILNKSFKFTLNDFYVLLISLAIVFITLIIILKVYISKKVFIG